MEHAEQVRLLKILMQQLDARKNIDAGRVLRNPAHVYTSRNLDFNADTGMNKNKLVTFRSTVYIYF